MARKKTEQAPRRPEVAVEEAQAAPQEPQPAADQTHISVSRGFGNWLSRNRCSLAFTSYQTGQLFLVGLLPNGQVSFHQQNYVRAMGVARDSGAALCRLALPDLAARERAGAARAGEREFRPALRAAQRPDHRRRRRPRAQRRPGRPGDLRQHQILLPRDDEHHPRLQAVWKPPFISRLAAEDRCHLNGLAMQDGVPAYVTAVSRSDMINGWRDRRHEGGVLIDVRDDRIVTDQLSMPHSPRVNAGRN